MTISTSAKEQLFFHYMTIALCFDVIFVTWGPLYF
jgi:hypothetical protein